MTRTRSQETGISAQGQEDHAHCRDTRLRQRSMRFASKEARFQIIAPVMNLTPVAKLHRDSKGRGSKRGLLLNRLLDYISIFRMSLI